MIEIKTSQEIKRMREAGSVCAQCMQEILAAVRPGITTKEFIRWCQGNYSNIWAFEPELANYKVCKQELDFPNCKVYNLG